jgi:tetratricopeptide (TPR) repeat protein
VPQLAAPRGAPIRTLFGAGPAQAPGPAARAARVDAAPDPAATRPGVLRRGATPRPGDVAPALEGPTRVVDPIVAAAGAVPAAPAIDEMFPEDEDGVSKLARIDPVDGLRASSPFDDDSGARPAPVAAPARRLAGGDARFDGETPRAPTDDMRTIRAGLGLPAEGTSPGKKVPPEILERERAEARRVIEERARQQRASGSLASLESGAEPTGLTSSSAATLPRQGRGEAGPRRRGRAWLLYAVVGLAVAGGAVYGGYKVRELRLDRQIARARAQAAAQAATDTYAGMRRAQASLARIVEVRGGAGDRAALARLGARMAGEFGEPAGAPPPGEGADALAARGFLALAAGDGVAVAAAAAALAKVAPDDPDAEYLAARGALLAGRPADAATTLRRAIGRGAARPAVLIALARAEAAQGRVPDALAAIDRIRVDHADHPGATIWQALIQARSRGLPGGGNPEAALRALVDDAARPPAERREIAAVEVAWARLALAEVALARGQGDEAKTALAAIGAAAVPRDPEFDLAVTDALLRAGDSAAARTRIAELRRRDPGSVAVRVLAARIALAVGDAREAALALDDVDLGNRPDALAVRGRARLATGAIDAAATDLDAALAVAPDALEAIVARAEVDLARGDAGAARRRLEPRYRVNPADVGLAIAFAAALRADGDVPGARTILAALDGVAATAPLALERGRLARAEGDYAAARKAFDQALELDRGGLAARLERAQLALDTGDAAAHRTMLDALAVDLPDSGAILVEAAMAHTLAGDLAGADALLTRAGSAGAPSWRLARERGRVKLRRLDPAAAIAELDKAKAERPADPESHLLALEAALVARGGPGAQRAVEDAVKSLRGSPVVALAKGIAALLEERTAIAIEELERAATQLAAAKAPPRELGRADYWVGRAYYLQGNLAQATAWLGRATTADPSNADAYFFLGQVAFERNQPAKMAAAYERAVGLDPAGNPQAWYFLAEHYARSRDAVRAKAACEAYLSRWPDGDFAEPLRGIAAGLK